MIFLEVVLVVFIFNTKCLRALETASLLMEISGEVKQENLLNEFMKDLKKFSFARLRHHRLLILGKEKNILQTAKVILEIGTPYFISTEAEAMVPPPNFGADSVVLFFIDGFTDFEIDSAFAKLPNNYKCSVLIVSLNENRTDQSITTTIFPTVKMKLGNVMFARLNGRVMKIYGRATNARCVQKKKLMNKWVPKKGFVKHDQVLGHDLAVNERGCSMFVSTFEILPTMILREDENKSLHITGGIEGHLITTIAKYLNMVPVVKVPSVGEQLWIAPDGTALGIIGEVARAEVSLGIGQIMPTPAREMMVDFTVPYNHECIVWVVPLTTKYSYSVVISEFSSTTWIMVILSVSLCCWLACAIRKLRLQLGHRSSLGTFYIIALTLNYAISRPPTDLLCKLFFLLYLNYSRIISTAYSTSLSSILSTTTPELAIVDEDGIIAAGLRAAGTHSSHEMLADQKSANVATAELINTFEVITSFEAALKRIADSRDIAYLRHLSAIKAITMRLYMAGETIKFYPTPNCVISYHSVMVTPKGSRLTGEINHIMMRLHAAGLYNYWTDSDGPSKLSATKVEANHHTLSRLDSIFFLYFSCLVPALVAFIVELIAFKLELNWFAR